MTTTMIRFHWKIGLLETISTLPLLTCGYMLFALNEVKRGSLGKRECVAIPLFVYAFLDVAVRSD